MPTRIPPDEAKKHLIDKIPPTYPQSARAALIAGNVILQINISATGAASVYRVVTGHALLVPAAVEAVNHWKYQPFEIDGKPAPVVTVVIITFSNSVNVVEAGDERAEILFQNDFWTAVESAQSAFGRGDYVDAEEQLKKANDLLSTDKVSVRHVTERWQWMTTMGQLRMQQQKYAEAGEYHKKALALYEKRDKDAPELAASLGNLGRVYVEEKQFDLAHDQMARSIAIYESNFKRAGSSNPGAQHAYGRAIAYQAETLWKLAKQRNDQADADKQCHTVLDFQDFLNVTDRASFVSGCQQSVNSAPASPK
jgi:TonB family protein